MREHPSTRAMAARAVPLSTTRTGYMKHAHREQTLSRQPPVMKTRRSACQLQQQRKEEAAIAGRRDVHESGLNCPSAIAPRPGPGAVGGGRAALRGDAGARAKAVRRLGLSDCETCERITEGRERVVNERFVSTVN